jgi:uncharacterized protein YjdB
MVSLPNVLLFNHGYRKTVRRIGCLAFIMMLIFNLFAASFIHVADAAAGRTVIMDKPQYTQAEAITLAYTGAALNGKDWIGIYRTGVTPAGSNPSLVWKYVNAGDGSLSLTNGLAPGVYDAVFLSNGGYTELARTTFQVIAPVKGVTLDQPSVSITQGKSVILTAVISPSNATDPRVSWTSSDPTVVSIAASGGTATVTGNRNGTATVTTTTYDGNFVASSNVTVLSDYINVTGITIDKPAVTMKKGQTAQLTATVTPTNASNPNVLWTSSNPSVATVTAGVYGMATIQALSVGTVTITAVSSDGGHSAVSNVSVNPVNGITLDKLQYTVGEPITLSYTGAAANGKDWVGVYKTGVIPPNSGASLVWTYAKTGDGKVSLDNALAPGTYDALLLFNDGYTVLDRKTFQVITRVPVTGVTLDQPNVRMTQGETKAVTAFVSPANENDPRVSWTSSDPTVVSVTATGGITTLSANRPGIVTVTSSTYDGNFTASANVRVDAPGYIRVSGISIDKPAVTLGKGQTAQVTATVAPANAANRNVVWTSSNPSVVAVTAGVNGAATVQAINGGMAVITAIAADDEGYSVVSHMAVNVPVNGILLDQTNLQLISNQTVQLHATVSPADALNKNLIWSSSDTSIVQVSGMNGSTDANILGLKVGKAIITVRTEDGNFTQDCTVNVTEQPTSEELLHLKFDDTVSDSSPFKTNIKVNGLSPVFVPGKFGKALQLSTTSVTDATYLDLANSDQFFKFGRNTDFTIAFWTKIPSQDNVENAIISNKDSSNGANTGWNISATGNIIRASYTTAGNPSSVMNMSGVVDNKWHHVIVSYQRDGMARFFRDGVEISSYDISSIMGDIDTPFTPKIGTDGKGKFLGKSNVILDEMRIFRKALSADEAMGLYKEDQVFVSGVTVDKTDVALNKGETTQLNAIIEPSNPDNPNVTWKSSNPFVASVTGGPDGTAIVTAVSGGTTQITVTTADGGFQAIANVTVAGPSNPVTQVKLNSSTLEVKESQTANLHAIISPSIATNQKLIWESSDPTIVHVTGLLEGTDAVVEALNPGFAIITVRTEDGNFTDTCIVTVDDIAGQKPAMLKMSFENNPTDIARGVSAAVYGNPTYVSGAVGKALLLDSPDQYLDLINPQFGESKDFALSFWLKSAATSDNRDLVSNKDGSNPANTGWSVGLENGGLHWNYKTSGSAPLDYVIPNVADNNWHHFAISHDRAYDGYADFYKDGKLVASVDISNSMGSIDSGLSTKLGIDGKGNLSGHAKVGFDELQMFNRTLKASEVGQQFSVALTPKTTLTGVSNVTSGQSFDVTYGISNVTQIVYAKEMTVNFDPTQLKLDAVDSLISGFTVVGQLDSPGKVRILMASTNPNGTVTGTEDILKMHFQALPVAQTVTASVYLSNVIIADANGLKTQLNSGSTYDVQIIAVDKTALNALITAAQALNSTKYTASTWAALQTALSSAIMLQNDVNAAQEQVDTATTNLQTAITGLQLSANKAMLIAKITEAQAQAAYASIGSNWGQYSESAVKALNEAINRASGVSSDANATQNQVDQAVVNLNAAVQTFAGAMNVKASVSDLALISSHYGLTSASSDWKDIRRYDINQDNKISIIDLVAIAKKILNQ